MNITTTSDGFLLDEKTYKFINETPSEVINEDQVHVYTDLGIILLDLSCTINEIDYTDINLFLLALKGE